MHRRLFVALSVIAMMGIGLVVAAKDPPTTTNIPKCGKTKGPVSFNHKKHVKDYKIACSHCHHLAADKKQKKDAYKPCAACHSGKAGGKKKSGCAEKSLKKNTYHLQCVGCHKKLKKGPRGCRKCHK